MMAQRRASSRSWQRPAITTLDLPKPKGAWFDSAAADRAMDFIALLPLVDGEHAGEPFVPMPWAEHELIRPLFGWKRANGTRLYREFYLRVARKNTKSTLCAGIAGVLTFADDEPGARVYAAAVDTDQAREVWGTFSDMVLASHALNPGQNRRVKVLRRSISYQPDNIPGAPARFHILSGETKNKDGLNIHSGILDELHAHPDRGLYDLINQGTASRRQPVIGSISTSGIWAPDSICVERDEYTRKVASRQIKDPSFLGIIYELDAGDRWDDPKVWIKANPGLGISIPLDFLKRECAKAKAMPAAQNAFRMKHCNQWMQQSTRWLDLDVWDEQAGSVIEPDLAGQPCYGSLDIGAVSDLTAWVLTFPGEDDHVRYLARFFCPEASLEPGKQNAMLYQQFRDLGALEVTPGNATDYSFVRERIVRDAMKFELMGVNADFLFQGGQLVGELIEEGIAVEVMRQTHMAYALPMKEFERRFMERKLHHGGNPVLRWMADNIVVRTDSNGNLKPDKEKSRNKIDGIVGMVMGCVFLAAEEPNLNPQIEIF